MEEKTPSGENCILSAGNTLVLSKGWVRSSISMPVFMSLCGSQPDSSTGNIDDGQSPRGFVESTFRVKKL
jgi:hypothetical protein